MNSNSDGEIVELTHPGVYLKEEYMDPCELTVYRVATSIGVQPTRILEVTKGQRSISPETGLLLDRFFGLSDGFWYRMQADYDLRKARRVLGDKLSKVQPFNITPGAVAA